MIEAPFLKQTWSIGEAWDGFLVPCIVVFACLGVFSVETSFTGSLVTGIIAISIWWRRGLDSTWGDFALAAFLFASTISSIGGAYLPNSLSALSQLVEGCLLYIAIRGCQHGGRKNLLIALNSFGVITAAYSIALFLREYAVWRSVGFDNADVTFFRRNLSLSAFAAYSGNEHLRFLYCIGFGALALFQVQKGWPRVLSILCVLSNLLCVILTFSRLAYFSVLVTLLVSCTLAIVYRVKVTRVVLGCLFLSVGLFYTFLLSQGLSRSFSTTLEWNHTESQVRSVQGRHRIALSSLNMVKVDPFVGHGIGNFAYTNTGDVRNAHDEYAPQSYDWFLQVGVEEGLLGIIAAMVMLIMPLVGRSRELQRGSRILCSNIVVIAGTVGIGCFALGQAALFGNRHLTNLTVSWLALANSGRSVKHAGARRLAVIAWLSVAVLAGILLSNVSHVSYVEQRLSAIAVGLRSERVVQVDEIAKRLVDVSPRDTVVRETYAAVLLKHHSDRWIQYLKTDEGHGAYFDSALPLLEEQYQSALAGDQTSDACWHNLSWIEWMEGRHDIALSSIRRAVQLEPYDPIYRASAGLFYEANGDVQTAATSFGKALEISPRIIESPLYADLKSRNPNLASESLAIAERTLSSRLPDPLASARLARLYFDTGRVSEAELLVRSSLQRLPNLGAAWLTLGELEAQHGNRAEAESDSRKAAYLLHIDHSTNIRGDDSEGDFVASPHAKRARSRYRTRDFLLNDMVPVNLLSYLSPMNTRSLIGTR